MAAVAAGVGVEGSMAAVAEDSVAALGAEAFEVVTVEAASVVVLEVIAAVTVAGDMDADGAVGAMGMALG
jgi:hypothetical protein